MPKLAAGNWVMDLRDDLHRRGFLRSIRGRKAHVLWIGAEKAETCDLRALRKSAVPLPLVLEGSLDRRLDSTRSGEPLLRAWLRAHQVRLAFKNVHTLDDILIMARDYGKVRPPFIHLSCHGAYDEENRAYITLAPAGLKEDRLHLTDPAMVRTFGDDFFHGMPILLSACLLGRYGTEMERFRRETGVGPVAAYTFEVYDYNAMLFELLLYQGVLSNGWPFSTAVEKALKAASVVKIRGTRGQPLIRLFR
jgi:hypothetical protein